MDPAIVRLRTQFNDDGTANYPTWPSTSGLLHEIRDQLQLLLQKLKSCEKLPDGSVSLKDMFAGRLKGIQVVWDRIGILSMMTRSVQLSYLFTEERARMKPGEVLWKVVELPRQLLPISDMINQLSFSFANTGSKIPEAIAPKTLERLNELSVELDLHCKMLGEEPTPLQLSPNAHVANRLESSPVATPQLNGAPLSHKLTNQVHIVFDSARRLQGSIASLLSAAKGVGFQTKYWSRIAPMYPSVYLDARDLNRALTKEVLEAIRLVHPLGSPPIRLSPQLSARHTYLEVLVHDVMQFLTIEKPQIDIALEGAMKERPPTQWDGPDSRHNQSVRISKVLEDWAPDHYLERQVGFLLSAASGLPLEDLRIHIEQEERTWLGSSLPGSSSRNGTSTIKRRRKPAMAKADRPLTPKQRQTVEVVARHKYNFASAARELGKDPTTLKESYLTAMKKLDLASSRSVRSQALPVDRRGSQDCEDRRG